MPINMLRLGCYRPLQEAALNPPMSTYETILAQFQKAQEKHIQGNLLEALALYDDILRAKPDLEAVHNNKGVVLRDLRRLQEALASFDRALEIDPDLAEAYNNKGFALSELGRLSQALASLDRAIGLKPEFWDAYNNKGVVLARMNRYAEALTNYDRAIALRADFGEAWSNRAEALMAMQQPHAAISSYQRALALMPNHVETLLNCALAFQKLGRFDDAKPLLEKVTGIEPTHKRLLSILAYGALHSCDWSTQERLVSRMAVECPAGTSIVPPLALIGYLDDPALLQRSSAHYLKDVLGSVPAQAQAPALSVHDKIRLAYVSGDFHEHATARLMVDLFERHHRSQFDVFGISFGPDDSSQMRQRVRRAFDQFHDVQYWSDADVVDLMRRLEVDIAVDLKGFTAGERPAIFVRRAAPIQVNYLGYPGTMASHCWDYIIADPIVLPRAQQPFYSEAIVHLDCCYQVNDPFRPIGMTPTRTSQGLPETGFVFCCFNNHAKITRPIFDVWMRLLHALPDSVLWLLDGHAADTLRSQASRRGIDAKRLIFAPLTHQTAHLGRLALADLVLDTLPYNAHTTASDALWAGVPVLTCRGTAFAGRVAASLLSAMDLEELITDDLAAYETRALQLARDGADRQSLRNKLLANRKSASLFDAERFCHTIEKAFCTMIEIARRGGPAVGFDVSV